MLEFELNFRRKLFVKQLEETNSIKESNKIQGIIEGIDLCLGLIKKGMKQIDEN